MNITTNIWLAQGETYSEDLTVVAAKVMDAVGGDPAKDTCTVSISGSGTVGVGVNVPGVLLTAPIPAPTG